MDMDAEIEKARKQILRDKHTLLEGYVVESLFERQFLSRNDDAYTKDWWVTFCNGKRLFFIVKKELNDVDKKMRDLLSEDAEVWQIFDENGRWRFCNGGDFVEEQEFVNSHNLRRKNSGLTASYDTRNDARQQKCLRFFEANGILLPVAHIRHFADDFMTEYFGGGVNMDFITLKNGVLHVIEVKFKYENRAGAFGINIGQYQLFEYLPQKGVVVDHFILYNSSKSKELSIFGFLESGYKKEWIWAVVLNDKKQVRLSVAPRETSVNGMREQAFVSIQKDKFVKVADLQTF